MCAYARELIYLEILGPSDCSIMATSKEPPPAMDKCMTCKSECSEAQWSTNKSCWSNVCRGDKIKHKHDFWNGEWMREDKRQRILKKEFALKLAAPPAAKELVKADTKEEVKADTKEEVKADTKEEVKVAPARRS